MQTSSSGTGTPEKTSTSKEMISELTSHCVFVCVFFPVVFVCLSMCLSFFFFFFEWCFVVFAILHRLRLVSRDTTGAKRRGRAGKRGGKEKESNVAIGRRVIEAEEGSKKTRKLEEFMNQNVRLASLCQVLSGNPSLLKVLDHLFSTNKTREKASVIVFCVSKRNTSKGKKKKDER